MRTLTLVLALVIATPAGAAVFIGNAGPNSITGTRYADYIEARQGNDRAWGGGGNDDILMGQGNDRAWGGTGADYMVGGDGIDWLYAGCDGSCDAGAGNVLFGGDGTDYLAADNNRFDDLNCGGGDNDHAWYDAGLDRVTNCEFRGGRRR